MTTKPSTATFNPVKTISLKDHPDISEAWIQQALFNNPTMLGLGPSVKARDRERRQPSGGRLDLLLQDEGANVRYEVEIQLGPTNETHIIRTIEYWDIERRLFPNYNHVAVIVAEEITSRFFNVISLFHSVIPLIAIQMTAIENTDGSMGLLFTRVLDLNSRSGPTDRSFWEKQSTKKILQGIDRVLELIQNFEPKAQLSYTKGYLGIWVEGRPNNFVVFHPRKDHFLLDVKMERTDENDHLIEAAGCDKFEYKMYIGGRYSLKFGDTIGPEHEKALEDLLRRAYMG